MDTVFHEKFLITIINMMRIDIVFNAVAIVCGNVVIAIDTTIAAITVDVVIHVTINGFLNLLLIDEFREVIPL